MLNQCHCTNNVFTVSVKPAGVFIGLFESEDELAKTVLFVIEEYVDVLLTAK